MTSYINFGHRILIYKEIIESFWVFLLFLIESRRGFNLDRVKKKIVLYSVIVTILSVYLAARIYEIEGGGLVFFLPSACLLSCFAPALVWGPSINDVTTFWGGEGWKIGLKWWQMGGASLLLIFMTSSKVWKKCMFWTASLVSLSFSKISLILRFSFKVEVQSNVLPEWRHGSIRICSRLLMS